MRNYMMTSDIAAPSPNIRLDEIWVLFEMYLVARLLSARQYQSYSFHFKRYDTSRKDKMASHIFPYHFIFSPSSLLFLRVISSFRVKKKTERKMRE